MRALNHCRSLSIRLTSAIGVHQVTIHPVTTQGEETGTPLTFSLRTSNVGKLIWYIIIAGGTLLVALAAGLLLDLVFSIDSILTAVGMTDHLPVMVIAVVVAVLVMLLAANPLANFIRDNPTVVMLALGFLLMIGAVLIADGFGVHVPKGYIYSAMAFSAAVEALNIWARRRREREA